jgi:CubicO group peptidase (beta-lactamase class C family)
MEQDFFLSIEKLVEQNISWKIFPGLELYFSYQDKVILHQTFGSISKEKNAPKLRKNCIFDIASLTKSYITSLAILTLAEQKLLKLKLPFSRYLTKYKNTNKSAITISELLTHISGLPAWSPLFEDGFDIEVARNKLLQMSIKSIPGSKMVYSCLGYLLLGEIVKAVSSLSLSQFCQEQIFSKLKQGIVTFKPVTKSLPYPVIPTGYCELRKRQLKGEVHDENAFLFNQEGGNAGVFANMEGLVAFNDILFNRGFHNGHQFLAEEYFDIWTSNQNPVNIEPRSAGWDINPIKAPYKSCGELMPEGAIGHLGFTGTSSWLYLPEKLAIIVLTNRVNISREGNLPQMRLFRPQVHNLILSSIYS